MLEPFCFENSLEGDNIRLIKHTHQYNEEMWNAVEESREHLRRYLFWVDKTHSIDDVAANTRKYKKLWTNQTNFAYIIIDKHSKKLLGCIDLHDIDRINRIASLGYWLRQDKVGFGYMSDAVRTLEKAAFNRGIHRLEISCDSQNKPSAAVALRNGYEYECTLKEAIYSYGEFHDQNIYVKFNR